MQYKETKYKVNTIKSRQNNTEQVLIQKDQKSLDSRDARKVIKKPVLLYDSDWILAEKEDISSAISQEEGTLLPERALYDFETTLNVPEKFLQDLKIEVLTRSEPEANIQGVFPYIGSAKRELSFQLYDWHGITYTNTIVIWLFETYWENGILIITDILSPQYFGCLEPPQPVDAYDFEYTINYYGEEYDEHYVWTFKYPITDFPVPIGQDPTYHLPVAEEYVYPNVLEYTRCGDPAPDSYWTQGATKQFYEVVAIYGLQEAKDLLNESYNNITYSDESDSFKGEVPNKESLPLTGNERGDYYISTDISVYYVWSIDEPDGTIDDWVSAGASIYKAYETIFTPEVATSNQIKKITKLSGTSAILNVSGDVLLISPANTETIYSDPLFPTYQATTGGDVEIRLKVYIDNPNYFTETKGYSRV